jgi:NAD+ kinase
MKVGKVGIIPKHDSADAKRVGDELAVWLRERAIDSVIDRISADLDLLIILGGDGTLLHVASQASRYKIPVVGVNLGSLGFLTEVSVANRYEALDKILAGSVVIEDRMMLKVRLCRSASVISEWSYALNDVVINKGSIDRVSRMQVWADDEFIASYRADGLIFSTPTGSTAYNLSAGGPIIHPEMRAIMLTPICPFMLESRPVLLPHQVKLTTKIVGCSDVKVIVDGRSTFDMAECEHLEVMAAENPLRLVCSPHKGYFEILRSKLNWGGKTF